ncbi:uncharacterized protein LACBIDRAFT_321452 [Laccaria bicolor S238N-H82]|uniref:Predicted protein n=1 Tax=Laccaria bicolor (strain S238N-H82 / ATCC MYA-4686) TaxID=486041 RepID=B0CQE8_LACBS|nr:uncharacterized protein LACBIDRAFT_321452 [Laccaria bicolor S238N-H82]EDR15543.1 predicted protein [Laccaria bicolor S238N-H82]|eukprot:XP_001873751.1 predicted protein [Laccaria bicolor S238N-H82]
MRILAVLTSTFFLWSSSCIALFVVTPSASNGWTNQGPQTSVQFLPYPHHVWLTKAFFIPSVSWQRVITDPLDFAIILTNQNRSLFPSDQTLSLLIDSNLLTASISPPAGGWPTPGAVYRVNLVLSANYPNTIYAQSNEFTIFQAGSTTTSITGSTSPSLSTPSSLLSIPSSSSTHPPVSPASPVDQSVSSSKRKLHNVAIALGVVCTILALCIVGLAAMWYRRHRASQHFPGTDPSQIFPGEVNSNPTIEAVPLSKSIIDATTPQDLGNNYERGIARYRDSPDSMASPLDGSRDNLQTSYRLNAQGLDVPPPSLAHKTSPSAAFASNGSNLASTDVSRPAEFLSRPAQGSPSRSPFATDGMR